MEKTVRKNIQAGECVGITLPRRYLETHNLKRGDKVEILYTHHVLLVKPICADKIEREIEATKVEARA